jgi:hypothetical protein
MTLNRVVLISFAIIGLLVYTKVVWQSGFDAGADTSLCVGASLLLNDGKFKEDEPACQRIEAYKSNPLWLFRRRG